MPRKKQDDAELAVKGDIPRVAPEKRNGVKPEGIALVERVITEMERLPGRIAASDGKPGGLVMFSDKKRPIIIGDLHANRENLRLILDHDSNRADLDSGRAACIILGDAFHDDRTGHMKDMVSSVEILDDLLDLIVTYPGSVYYIKGNHDTFDERLRKSGIYQGLEFKKQLLSSRGDKYVDAVSRLFDSLPYFIIGNKFVITHAGPPRGGIVRDELVNIRNYPEKMHQLIWTRVNEFHGGNPSLKEYGEKDLRLALDLLDMPGDTHFIVGHNPIWSDGNKTGVWLNVIGIKNHHILYSGYGSVAPYITFIGDEMSVKFAKTSEPEVYHYG